MKKIFSLPRQAIVSLISLYQATLSPDHGWFKYRHPHGFCRHYPSCSEYTKQAVNKFGAIKGSFLGLKRVIRCNPWAESRVDLIPN